VFLVEDKPMANLVFTWEDPRKAGYTGYVVDGVTLDYDMEAVHNWPDGHPAPEPCVGRDPDDSNHYKVFRDSSERQSAGYQPVAGNAVVFGFWSDYLKALHPDLLDDEKWYAQLDLLDDASRRRRERAQYRTRRRIKVETGLRPGWPRNTCWSTAASGKCGTCPEERQPRKFAC